MLCAFCLNTLSFKLGNNLSIGFPLIEIPCDQTKNISDPGIYSQRATKFERNSIIGQKPCGGLMTAQRNNLYHYPHFHQLHKFHFHCRKKSDLN